MSRIIRVGGGLGEASASASFQWPTAQEYAQNTSAALAQVKDMGFTAMNTEVFPGVSVGKLVLTASAGGHQQVLTTILESAIGKGLELTGVSALGAATPQFLACMQDALNGNLEGVVVGGVQLAAQVSEALSAIPIMGTIANFVCNIISMIFDSQGVYEESVAEADRQCQDKLENICSYALQSGQPIGTGSEGVTPSDMFRGHLYAYRAGTAPPANVAGMYLGLCGGETQGFGYSRQAYDSLLTKVRTLPGCANVGISPDIQRVMWKLIKGIIFSAESPEIRADITPIGDKGRSLFPILQDIVRNEYLRNQITGNGGWNPTLALALSDDMFRWFTASASVQSGAGVVTRYCDCVSPVRHAGLTEALIQSVGRWQSVLQEKFWKNGHYIYGASGVSNKVTGIIGLSKIQANKIVGAKAMSPSKYTAPQKAALVAGAAGGSYLAWEIVRRIITHGI